MASVQAHLLNLLVRWQVKRKLRSMPDVATMRRLLRAGSLPAPRGVRINTLFLGGIAGDLVEAAGAAAAAAPTLLYLHGGAYIGCSPATHRPITGGFAQRGFRVVVPDYRLAPENPYPAALDDAVAVYRALLHRGTRPADLAVAGDSAGGGLALALLLALRDRGLPLPRAAAVFSPWTDLAATGESLRSNSRRDAMFYGANIPVAAEAYLGGADPRNPLISPLYGDFHGLPPLLVHVGAREVLRDDSTRLAERARAAGVTVELTVWPVVPHVVQIAHRLVPEGRRSLDVAAAFLHAAQPAEPAPADEAG